ncbi:MAG: Recombinase [Firmicutes bacterium]|nr:Recombinase [Bacillota bacterium]
MTNRSSPIVFEPACFYLRKSREDHEAETRGEGETLAKHRKALFKLASEYGVTIAKVYEEIVSGESVIHRPAMLTLLQEVEIGRWRSVWCMDVDRLGRGGMQDQGLIIDTFKTAGTKIVTPRKIYDLSDEFDEEYTEFEAFMARKELKIITRRLQSGRRRSVEDGNYIAAKAPYGYVIESLPTGRTLVPHPEQATVVQLIFELYTNDQPELRLGSTKIANELNRLGYATYTGKSWDASTVLFILKNEVYAGRVQWRKREEQKASSPDKKEVIRTRPREEWIDVPGKHPPLISPALFAKAQQILKAKSHVPCTKSRGMTNPLAGLIKCGLCGNSMVYRSYTRQKYSHLVCYNPNCINKSSRFDYVETAVLEGLRSWLGAYHTKFLAAPVPNSCLVNVTTKTLHRLEKELTACNFQKDRLQDLLEQGVYDSATYFARYYKITMRITELQMAIRQAKLLITKEQATNCNHELTTIPDEKLITAYEKTADPSLKNNLLKVVLEYAVYVKSPDQRGPEFALTLFPRLPH